LARERPAKVGGVRNHTPENTGTANRFARVYTEAKRVSPAVKNGFHEVDSIWLMPGFLFCGHVTNWNAIPHLTVPKLIILSNDV